MKSQDWEQVKRQGEASIKKWIAEQMSYKSAVVVLIGNQTATRRWVRHEIIEAWNKRKPLVGVRIHGLADSTKRTDRPGADPFAEIHFDGGGTLADYVPVFTPPGSDSQAVYASIKSNLQGWVSGAYKRS